MMKSIIRFAMFALLLSVLGFYLMSVAVSAQSPNDGFDPNANSRVNATTVQPDGKIIIVGFFTTVGGAARNRIARLNVDGTLDANFNPNADNAVLSTAVQSDGKIIVGGDFTAIGGVTRNNIARLNADGSLDTSFDPNADNSVYSMAIQSDGKIIAGGIFSTIGGTARGGIARLSNDTPALSKIAVTKTTVTLTRDGSAPLFSRVIFERSDDNGATYTFIGNAASGGFSGFSKNGNAENAIQQPSNYTLTGQNFPSGQNFLIRARGFYGGGYQNNSEQIEDKVQTAYLSAMMTAAGVVIGGRVTTSNGRGLSGATVTVTDETGNTKRAKTTAFGNYKLENLAAGLTYIVTVSSKRYIFDSQALNATEDANGVNFVAVNR